jgi:malate dehydrogenase (oxaloacetate-decarboxylating)
VTTRRQLEPYKQKYAKDPDTLDWFNEESDLQLERVAAKAGITVLIGTSGQQGCFSREVIAAVMKNTAIPVVMPLSNPTSMAEALPEDLYEWTGGKVLVGTGSPFKPVCYNEKTYRIGQCNNVFVFPGVGLGVLTSGAREVRPEFFTAAARAVSDCVGQQEMAQGCLMPDVTDLKNVTLKVALAVGASAIDLGVSRHCAFSNFQHDNDVVRLGKLIRKMRWEPDYLPLVGM